jgi:hypothetical protein
MLQRDRSAEDAQRALDNAVKRINEMTDLKEEARERMVRDVYSKARAKVVQDAEEAKQELLADLRAARRVAFAPPDLTPSDGGRRPDPAFVAWWYAQEIQKVREIREPRELEHMLQEALLTNNLPACKAVLIRAYELQNERLVTQYFESFPEELDAYENYSAAAEALNEWERAQNSFSSPHRLPPLEKYLN